MSKFTKTQMSNGLLITQRAFFNAAQSLPAELQKHTSPTILDQLAVVQSTANNFNVEQTTLVTKQQKQYADTQPMFNWFNKQFSKYAEQVGSDNAFFADINGKKIKLLKAELYGNYLQFITTQLQTISC